jgi:hypothetical protein
MMPGSRPDANSQIIDARGSQRKPGLEFLPGREAEYPKLLAKRQTT